MAYNNQIKMSIAIRAATVLHDLKTQREREIDEEELIKKIHLQFGKRYMPTDMITQFVKDNFVSRDGEKNIVKGNEVKQVKVRLIHLPD